MAIGPVHEREKEDPTGKEGGQREDSVHFVQKGVLLLQLQKEGEERAISATPCLLCLPGATSPRPTAEQPHIRSSDTCGKAG